MSLKQVFLQYDIARGRVPTVETVSSQLELLVPQGLTGIVLYLEGTLENSVFPSAGSGETRVDRAYVDALGQLCARHRIQLIPHVQILGHLHGMLSQPGMERFRDDDRRDCLRIDLPELREKMKAFLSEVAEMFPTPYLHCGGDEAFWLGMGKSQPWFRKMGYEEGIADYVNEIHGHLKSLGKTMLFYADECIGYPRLTAMLNPDIVLVNWAYCYRDEAYEQENWHYARHRAAVAGHPYMVQGNVMAEYIFTPYCRLQANTEIWQELGDHAEAYIMSDWGSCENINPYSLSLMGSWYILHKLKDSAYGLDAFVQDICQLAGYDASATGPAVESMLLVQSQRYFPESYREPLLGMFYHASPDSAGVAAYAIQLDDKAIRRLYEDMRKAEVCLKAQPATTVLAQDLRALTNRLVAVAIRIMLCQRCASYKGALWIRQEQLQEQQELYQEYVRRMKQDMAYLDESWHRDACETCYDRAREYMQKALESTAAALVLKPNVMSVFPPRS